MIHSDSHQINARWHGLPSWQRRLAPSGQVLREYRHKCVLMPRPVSLLPCRPLISILHTSFLLLISSYGSARARDPAYLAVAIFQIPWTRGSSPLSRSLPLLSVSFLYLATSSPSPCLLVSRDFARATAPAPWFSLSSLSSMRNSMLRVNIMESPRILGGLLSAAQGSKQISKWHGK